MKWLFAFLFLPMVSQASDSIVRNQSQIHLKIYDDAIANTTDEKKLPVMVFDLGKTIVDHTKFIPDLTGKLPGSFAELWYINGVREYILSLREAGYPVVLMVNIPANWGITQADKLNTLKASVAKSWQDSIKSGRNPEGSHFEWELFDLVILPRNDSERKGNCKFEDGTADQCNLIFYDRVLEASQTLFSTSKIIYQSENRAEIKEAQFKGMCTRQAKEIGHPEFLLPFDQVEEFERQCYRNI